MSVTYTIRGRRFIRPYTAPTRTPTTAAGSDAEAIGDNMCRVKWVEAAPDAVPCFPSYNDPDGNAASRDFFDAAEWCADHDSKSKTHVAYANAAIYRFAIPEAARGLTLEDVRVTVTCDPYTPQGARVAAMCTDSDDFPETCSEIRTMADYAVGVCPRTETTDSETGNVYWYEKTDNVDLELNDTGKKWLLVFIGLERYRARNGWLEGAAKIGNIKVRFSGAVEGWSESDPVDLASTGGEITVAEGASLPLLPGTVETADAGVRTVQRQMTGDTVSYDPGKTVVSAPTGTTGATGLSTAYAAFSRAEWTFMRAPVASPSLRRIGAAFVVRRSNVTVPQALPSDTASVPVWQITSSALLIPFAVPVHHVARKIRLDWSGLTATGGRLNVWIRRGVYQSEHVVDVLNDSRIYTAEETSLESGWELLGVLQADGEDTSAVFDVGALTGHFATILLTAYLDIADVDMDSTFPQGISTMDVDDTSSTASGMDTGWSPDVTLIY